MRGPEHTCWIRFTARGSNQGLKHNKPTPKPTTISYHTTTCSEWWRLQSPWHSYVSDGHCQTIAVALSVQPGICSPAAAALVPVLTRFAGESMAVPLVLLPAAPPVSAPAPGAASSEVRASTFFFIVAKNRVVVKVSSRLPGTRRPGARCQCSNRPLRGPSCSRCRARSTSSAEKPACGVDDRSGTWATERMWMWHSSLSEGNHMILALASLLLLR
jgi:hypothetical protein